jgi:hypothetical protein
MTYRESFLNSSRCLFERNSPSTLGRVGSEEGSKWAFSAARLPPADNELTNLACMPAMLAEKTKPIRGCKSERSVLHVALDAETLSHVTTKYWTDIKKFFSSSIRFDFRHESPGEISASLISPILVLARWFPSCPYPEVSAIDPHWPTCRYKSANFIEALSSSQLSACRQPGSYCGDSMGSVSADGPMLPTERISPAVRRLAHLLHRDFILEVVRIEWIHSSLGRFRLRIHEIN